MMLTVSRTTTPGGFCGCPGVVAFDEELAAGIETELMDN